GALPPELFTLPFEGSVVWMPCDFEKPDGFVKSPYAALPFVPPPCGVPEVRLGRRDSGALPPELFTLPFEGSVVWKPCD
ncbi:MAG TPA: hypothetical protein PKY58_11675, partial [Syntrophales bacterium]|nr:hypothetical protein [Syntrophales bacterium]HQQ28183.1 hypothetical protein [Syntrophales bacterium]